MLCYSMESIYEYACLRMYFFAGIKICNGQVTYLIAPYRTQMAWWGAHSTTTGLSVGSEPIIDRLL